MGKLTFSYLADRLDALETVARWYFDCWGHLIEGETLDRSRARLPDYLNRGQIPFILVAEQEGSVIGAAQLKFREMGALFPDYEHWLGGVYIDSPYRRHGFGAELVEAVARAAGQLGVATLYLQTEALDGGLYARLGWSPIQQVAHHGLEVLVMKRALQASHAE